MHQLEAACEYSGSQHRMPHLIGVTPMGDQCARCVVAFRDDIEYRQLHVEGKFKPDSTYYLCTLGRCLTLVAIGWC